ncbi:hypothetical protein GCM10023149_52710 [Mucilaginibacter gynuensis]|uniref:Uncharacterized protein n=1 Tax=Mucilaginibacter gynuensis TaxID=1302236 RepID=A0ABP8HL76_9SPHI
MDVTFFFLSKKKVTKEKNAAAQGTFKGCAWAGLVLPVPYDAAFLRLTEGLSGSEETLFFFNKKGSMTKTTNPFNMFFH